jgi:hypothetical protein
MTEREFLKAELQRTQTALAVSADDARQHALDLADVGYWGRNYPWQTVGVTAAAGFLIGAAIAPKKRQEGERAEPVRPVAAKGKQSGWAKPALTAAVELGRFVFQNVLLTGWQAAQAPPAEAPEPEMAGVDY